MWRDTWCATCRADISPSCEDDEHDVRAEDVLDASDRRDVARDELSDIDREDRS